tara:strand:- start:8131 stop:9780 length:1650 start_codon:yes stop_codon:yes gene_type:complete
MASESDDKRVSQASTSRVAPVASNGTANMELVCLVAVCGMCVVMQLVIARRGAVRHSDGNQNHVAFQRLRKRYNVVYAFGTFGDWIQGAYLYALYREHGFEMNHIGYIFVLGYFASATLGTYVASLGDSYGHRILVMLYGISYGVACVMMRYANIYAIIVSRVLSGVSYSLLFSSFESWAIVEADRLKIDRKYLVQLFSTATFFNAVSAVIAGVVGNFLISATEGSLETKAGTSSSAISSLNDADDNRYTPAFDVGAVSLFLCAMFARRWWAEVWQAPVGLEAQTNETDNGTGVTDVVASTEETSKFLPGDSPDAGVRRAARMVLNDQTLFTLGLMNSLYEAALHVFVFVWTPALERRYELANGTGNTYGIGNRNSDDINSAVPHGLVFSLFMACKMAGSSLYSLIGDRVPHQRTLRVVFLGSALSFFVPLVIKKDGYKSALFSFCVFEFGLGAYWPAMAVARAELVPNHIRATMTSMFRVPLNMLVIVCLTFAGNAGEQSFLTMCFVMMTACLLFSGKRKRSASSRSTSSGDVQSLPRNLSETTMTGV